MTELDLKTVKLPKIPQQYVDSYDGHEWREKATEYGWYVPGSWGREGWNLGKWPYMQIALWDSYETMVYAFVVYIEGDLEVHAYKSPIGRDTAVTEIAARWWRAGWADGPADLPEDGYLPHHYGPYRP